MDDIYALLDQHADKISADVIHIRHHLHAHPELSNREEMTASFIIDQLVSLDLDEIHTNIAGHGVIGILHGTQGPSDRTIALRADMDALPILETSGIDFASKAVDQQTGQPVSHACGHDMHMAMLLGAARVLGSVRDSFSGTVMFIFQPAEEGPPLDEQGGAREMVKFIDQMNHQPGMVFGIHVTPMPTGMVACKKDIAYSASQVVKITVKGKGSHGSSPWTAADPVPVACDIVTQSAQLYRSVKAYNGVSITFGEIITNGRHNVIGDQVELLGSIRALKDYDMDDLKDRMIRLATGLATAHGLTAEVEFFHHVPALINEPSLVDMAMPTLERIAGDIFEGRSTMGYDDISEFITRYSGLYVSLGCQDTQIIDGRRVDIPGGRGFRPNHNSGFYADDEAISVGVRLHAHMAVDYLLGKINKLK